jgi:hypothetical protein
MHTLIRRLFGAWVLGIGLASAFAAPGLSQPAGSLCRQGAELLATASAGDTTPARSVAALTPSQRRQVEKALLKLADRPGELVRREKQYNGNAKGRHSPDGVQTRHRISESPDPARPLQLRVNGKSYACVYSSGRYKMCFADVETFLRGGLQNRWRETITDLFEDGRGMRGPYHTGSLKWDAYLVPWPDGKGGTTYVGYGGAMVQPYKMVGAPSNARKLPEVALHNPSRDRHAFSVEFAADGKEIWHDRGSVHGNRPHYDGMIKPNELGIDADWIGPEAFHGYGGRPLQNQDGTPMIWDGTPWFTYERVTEVKTVIHPVSGKPERLPGKTEIRAQRMKNPYLLYRPGDSLPDGRTVGEEVVIFNVDSPANSGDAKRAEPYPATSRGGANGHLVEGFNPSWGTIAIKGEKFYVATVSTGNYVDGGGTGAYYGANLLYRRAADGPIGTWLPVLDDHGDLTNFTKEFEDRYNLSWVGRLDIFPHTTRRQSPDGTVNSVEEYWALGHGIDLDTLPKEFPRSGFPPAHQFEMAFRNGYILPVEWDLKDGKPWMKIPLHELTEADVQRVMKSPRNLLAPTLPQ